MDRRMHSSQVERSEQGVALLLTILLLLIVSAIGVSSLNRAGDELQVASTSRRQLTNVAAAEAALKLVGQQLFNAQAGTGTANAPILVADFAPEMGRNTVVRTGTIGDDGTAKEIQFIGTAGGESGDLRIGYQPSKRRIYRVNVVATDPSGGNVQLQAQFSVRGN